MRHGVREVGDYQIYSNMAHYLDCRWRGVVLMEYPPAFQKTKEEIVKLIAPPTEAQDEHAVEVDNLEDDDNLSGIERLAKRRRTSGDSDGGDNRAAATQGTMGLMEIEFHAYESMTIECKDNPTFWNSVKTRLPYLAKAAQMVFSVMPSSAPVERVFSVSGRAKDKRRSQLSPDSLEALTLINMNMDTIEDIKSSKKIEKRKMPSVNFEVTREPDLDALNIMEDSEDEEDLDDEEMEEDVQEPTDEED